MASPAEIAMDFNLPVDLIMKYNEILKEDDKYLVTVKEVKVPLQLVMI